MFIFPCSTSSQVQTFSAFTMPSEITALASTIPGFVPQPPDTLPTAALLGVPLSREASLTGV